MPDLFEAHMKITATAVAEHPPVEDMTDAERLHLGIGATS